MGSDIERERERERECEESENLLIIITILHILIFDCVQDFYSTLAHIISLTDDWSGLHCRMSSSKNGNGRNHPSKCCESFSKVEELLSSWHIVPLISLEVTLS